ncbi:hypothetical protein Avbf_08231 [Armadillidium vulgare]|nr:hypothetical protein Avbf_08231 [Armadillidium vulgare]
MGLILQQHPLKLFGNWRYFDDGELLVFDIDKRHRYCNNIGREHKSNSVMYVVNLRLGVFYQKCHDPDCKDFRSNERKLPLETMPWKLINDDDVDMLVAMAQEIEAKGLENDYPVCSSTFGKYR